jgi:hypothetical protein
MFFEFAIFRTNELMAPSERQRFFPDHTLSPCVESSFAGLKPEPKVLQQSGCEIRHARQPCCNSDRHPV